MLQDTHAAAFMASIGWLRSQPCWGYVAGAGTGSVIALDFGGKKRRPKPLTNPYLTPEQQSHVGEFSLFVRCAWRLDLPTAVVCGSSDSDRNDGPIVRGLRRLIGLVVREVSCSAPAFDLAIEFDEGFMLKIFCDKTDLDEYGGNYSYTAREETFLIGPRGKVEVSGRVC